MQIKEIEKILEKEGTSIIEQSKKCKICPCVKDGIWQGCYNCEHFGIECDDSDCSTSHINRKNNLALCSADICVMTRWALEIEKEGEGCN